MKKSIFSENTRFRLAFFSVLRYIFKWLFEFFILERISCMKYTLLALFAALFLVFTSSWSFLARGEQIVSVTVTPSDAAVIANGAEYHMGESM